MASMNLPDGRQIAFPDGLKYDQVKSIADAAMASPPAQAPKKTRIQIGNRLVEVDDSFLKMSPQDQQSTVDEIEAAIDGHAAPSGSNFNPAAAKTNLQTAIPPADIQTGDSKLAHRAKLGAQAVGQGVVADTLGLPADFKDLMDWAVGGAVNGGISALNATAVPLTNKVLDAAGAEVRVPDIPPGPTFDERRAFREQLDAKAAEDIADWTGLDQQMLHAITGFTVPGGERIGEGFSNVAEAAGYEPAVPQTSGERLAYEATRLGSGALSMGGALRTGAKGLAAGGKKLAEMPALSRPYVKAPNRALIGDAGGGVGAATALHALDENASESLKNSIPIRVLVAALGGHAGNNLTSAAISPKTLAEKAASWTRDPTPELRDPETGASPRHRNVAQASQFVQERATNPAEAASTIAKNQQFFEDAGGAMPTSGLMSDDLGMAMIDKALRNAEPKPFLERDKALRGSAAEDIAATRPAGADPYEARSAASTIKGDRLRGAYDAKRMAESDAVAADDAERALAQDLQPYGGQGPAASEDLDKVLVDTVLKPLQGRKNDLFDGIDPDGNVQRDLRPLATLSRELQDQAKTLPEAVRRQVLPDSLLSDFVTKFDKGETMSFRDLNETRSAIAGMEQQARTNSQFPLAGKLNQLKSAISQDAKTLAAEGGEAGDRALEAMRFYEEQFAPIFAQGEGGNFRKDFNRDDGYRTKTPPTATAGRFLREGPGAKEAAASLQNILAASPKGADGAAAARRYVLSDMIRAVGADGKVSETALRRWINNRSGMLSQVPEIDKEVRGLLDEVVNRSATTGRLRQEVEKAAAGLNRTQRDLDKSALSLLIDTDPKRAAESVLNSRDPVGAAVELRKAFEGNPPAERGWRAAVSDYLVERLGSSGKAGIADDLDAVGLEKINGLFRKNEAALRTIFGDDMRYLNQAKRRLDMLSNKSVQAARDSKAPTQSMLRKALIPIDVVLRLWFGALEGGSKSRKYRVIADQLPDTTDAANELIKRAMLDPEVAKHLLTRPQRTSEVLSWNRRLNRLMGWADAARSLDKEE